VIGRSDHIVDHILEGRVHNLGRVEVQETVVEMIVEFSKQCATDVVGAR